MSGPDTSDVGGTLYVVSTPIGNMADITLRALDVLKTVPLVAAEDTRLTRRLWARHVISTRMVSYHARSPQARRDELLAHLAGGSDLALVTDAGTPLVSDPGNELVAAWAARGGTASSRAGCTCKNWRPPSLALWRLTRGVRVWWRTRESVAAMILQNYTGAWPYVVKWSA